MAHMQYCLRTCLLQLSCKFGESAHKLYSVIVLTSSSGTNHLLNDHEDLEPYGPYLIPSEMMPYYSHPASLVNLFANLIEL